MDLATIQEGDYITWQTRGFSGEPTRSVGIVRSIGETYPGSGVTRVWARRTGKKAKLYAGTVTGVDPADIIDCTRPQAPGRGG